ncbi:hypothetical protein GTA08_BOTSDO00134 [Botryosphaeria dothidea]|uniref:Uncharacterized protein n=1 Tax=Botryosphaeria dothidea TaxID=55169 RepID=A0A8H4JA64_9PEZI|nr:hypothetical protein GTA08_BOTSDO00134 [Botryosphaeria dothidea]
MSFVPSTLYYLSSAINAVSIPGHIAAGRRSLKPALQRIPSTPDVALGRISATVAWDMVNALLATSALLNYLLAKNGGPKTVKEAAIVGTSVLAGAFVGWRFFKVKFYRPLSCLWVAPALSLPAMLWQHYV